MTETTQEAPQKRGFSLSHDQIDYLLMGIAGAVVVVAGMALGMAMAWVLVTR